ncbi:hypothetical protein ACNKHU_15765 [Shigella flexneri]
MPNNRGMVALARKLGLTLISSRAGRGDRWPYAKSCPARGIISKVLEMSSLNRDWCYYYPTYVVCIAQSFFE